MKKSGEEYLSILDNAKATIKYLWKFIIIELIIIIVLSVTLLNLKEVVRVKVELPAKFIYKNTPVVLAGVKGANLTYYKLWAQYLTEEIANFTPTNIDKKILLLEKTFYPDALYTELSKIKNLEKLIKANLIYQTFKIDKIDASNIKKDNGLIKSLDLKITGIANQTINKENKKTKTCHYFYKMKYVEGILYVEKIGTDCF